MAVSGAYMWSRYTGSGGSIYSSYLDVSVGTWGDQAKNPSLWLLLIRSASNSRLPILIRSDIDEESAKREGEHRVIVYDYGRRNDQLRIKMSFDSFLSPAV